MKFIDYQKDASTPGAISAIILCFVTALIAELTFRLGAHDVGYGPAFSRIIIVFMSLYIIHSFCLYSLKRYKPTLRDLISTHIVILLSLVIIFIGRVISLALAEFAVKYQFIKPINPESLHYIIPIAVGGLIIQSVKGIQYSTLFAFSLTAVLTNYTSGIFTSPYVLVSTLVACLSLRNIRARSAYVKAGANIALAVLPFAVFSCLFNPELTTSDITIRLIAPFIAGILCTFIALGVTPIVEYFGGYVTDIRLIEISTLDHPLLKSLSVHASGTWNHSMVLGMMVEAASEEIGANSVLARVGAYFHDVGKIKKPQYFVENQRDGENRHDKLSPSMSALIIRSHVKDGVELAKKHNLPGHIIDMIEQHHGTSRIEFFYQKAQQEAREQGGEDVDISLYTYSGPKPQTREAGLLMLADSIEPASRTIPDPTYDRLQGLVQKIINKIFSSGQLNECDLTLRDLHKIAKCYTKVLASIYHQRVAYAEPAEKVKEEVASSDHQEHSKQTESSIHEEGSKEDLKRLGLQD